MSVVSSSRPQRSRVPAGKRKRAKPRRTWKVVLAVFVVLTAVVVAGGVTAYMKVNAGIKTFDSAGLSKHRPPPPVAGQNILLIGSDSRAGADRKLGGAGTAVGRSDTTLLLHIYQGGKRAAAVSIPRDALVDIPRCLLPNHQWSAPQQNVMFNSAFSVGQTPTGNPACTVNTVESMTHMRIDHTVVVDFAGFAAMTKIIGGVKVCVPNNVYQGDLNPNLGSQGKLLFHRGTQTVSGPKALDYVRMRHGIGDGSDIGRMGRQQAFLASVISKIQAQGLTPTHLLPLAEAATKNMTVDDSLGTASKLLSFALSVRHMKLGNIDFLTAPWRYDGPRVALVHPDVDKLWSALRNDQPLKNKQKQPTQASSATQTVSAIKQSPVNVLNGTSVTGLAGTTAQKLKSAGLSVGQIANADSTSYTHTVVGYGAGEASKAHALATLFPGATVEQSQSPGLTLTLGSSHGMAALDKLVKDKPTKLPTSVTKSTRTAKQGPCAGVSYG